jgi:dienelactone hydrolase
MTALHSLRIPSSEREVELELLFSRPPTPGPHPTVVFNHGSTGRGNNQAMFSRRFAPTHIQKYFTDRGWAVVFPQRRGRGKSGGRYLEGLREDGHGYSCELSVALAGFERAVEDVDSVVNYLRTRSDVRRDCVVIGGASRGGILSIAYAGMRPETFVGAINFNGGWLGRGCSSYDRINPMIFQRGANFPGPTLWLHGTNDQYYRMDHCRDNFRNYTAAGGRGRFVAVSGGHMLIFKPNLWENAVTEYLAQIERAV